MTAIWRNDGTGWGILSAVGFPDEAALWRSVFVRRAPSTVEAVEDAMAPVPLKQGSVVTAIEDRLLQVLRNAYEEAARGPSNGVAQPAPIAQ